MMSIAQVLKLLYELDLIERWTHRAQQAENWLQLLQWSRVDNKTMRYLLGRMKRPQLVKRSHDIIEGWFSERISPPYVVSFTPRKLQVTEKLLRTLDAHGLGFQQVEKSKRQWINVLFKADTKKPNLTLLTLLILLLGLGSSYNRRNTAGGDW